MRRTILSAVIMGSLMLGSALASAPQLINYQGRLTDGDGELVKDSEYEISFTIYDAPVDGNIVWTEERTVVTQSGLFSLLLGSVNPIFDSVFRANPRYLAIRTGGGELAPRTMLVTIPWAFRVNTVDGSTGGQISGDLAVTEHLTVGPSEATGDASVAIGEGNTASGFTSSVTGGADNTASGLGAVIGGGGVNEASGDYSVIGGGIENSATATATVVGGGEANSADGNRATVSGGQGNGANAAMTTVGGGQNNSAGAIWSTVSGGYGNEATDSSATVSGGRYNFARGGYSVIGGGGGPLLADSNTANGISTTVSGGRRNVAEDFYGTVSGGSSNVARGPSASIGGGYRNMTYSGYCTVAGGFSDTAIANAATVGGGWGNSAAGQLSTVSGGYQNKTTAQGGFIGGGQNHRTGYYSTVAGGGDNEAYGSYAMVPGGVLNEASGRYSFAAGRQAKADHNGSFVWADTNWVDFNSSANNEFSIRASGGVRIFTEVGLTSGVTMAAGASSWTFISDSTLKQNIREVDYENVLHKLAEMPIKQWSYQAQDEAIEHIGPMAQDFYRQFGLDEDERHINSIDPAGVALAAIKALHERSQDLEQENQTLKKELDELRKLTEEIMNRLDQ